jgi:tetratricopeptide (TPR) repeat protein
MRFRRSFQFVSCAVMLPVIFSACSGNPQVRRQKYFLSGQRYFEKAKYAEAAIEFVNAAKVDPNYAEAHHQLAETYLRLQKPEGALQELGRTIQLQPDDYEARVELANLLILGHNLAEAREHVDFLLKQRPSDPLVHSVDSSLLAAQGKVGAAIEEMRKSIALDSGRRWQFYLSLALLQVRDAQPVAAEASFQKVIELNPAAAQARLLLGSFYQSRSRNQDAEREFQEAIAVDQKSPEPRVALARLYLAEGERAEAEGVANLAKHDFPDNSDAYRMLANVYFVSGNIDKALAEYTALNQAHPADLQVKKDFIQLLLQKGQFVEANRLDAEVLKANPNDNDALVYRSQSQISNGHANDAIAALETVIKNDPGNGEAHYVLGIGYEKLGNIERAESEWRDAVRLRPDLLDAVRTLAGLAMGRGDMEALDQEATEIIKLQPESPEGYALRALANVNRKRFSVAEVDVRKAIEIAPQSSFGYVQMGNLKFAEKQFEEAGRAYQAALDSNPNSKDALRGLMGTYVARNRFDQAIATANVQITKQPNNSGFYELLGTTLFINKKDLNGAEAAFEKSAELDKRNSSAQLELAQVQAAKGATDQAIATCGHAIVNSPNEPSFYILLGDLYQSRRDWNHATEAYQKALAIKPQNPLASNDLASVMLQSGANLDVALSLAQTARRGLPESPGVADTLGWIYFQKGAYHSAVDSLREALRLARDSEFPDNSHLHYHLGMAYAKSGETTLARQQLETALKMNPNSSDAADARKQLAQLKS